MGYLIIFKINSEGAQCTNNPIPFGVKKLQQVNKYPVMCSCTLLSPAPAPTLHFNETSSWIENPINTIAKEYDQVELERIFSDWADELNNS